MKTLSRRAFVLVSALAIIGFAPVSVRADREAELQERFKKRLPDLRDAKAATKAGETFGGMIEAVDEKAIDDKLKKVLAEENDDRRELYKLIAAKEKVKEDKVAERAGERNFQKAKSGEFLKDKDGKWKKKK